jgi:hypothetical protein
MPSDAIVALQPFGLVGLAIFAIVTLVSLASVIGNIKLPQAWLFALLIFGGIGAVIFLSYTSSTKAYWTNVGTLADWGGNDEDCEPAALPIKILCDDQRLGRIAVCWDHREDGGYPPGKAGDRCRGKEPWCTYKNSNVRIGIAATGQAPKGRVYVCGTGLIQ